MIGLDEHILYIANKESAKLSRISLQRVWYFIVGFLILKDMEDLAYKEFMNSETMFSKDGVKVLFIQDKYKKYELSPIEEGRCIEEFNKEEINTAIRKIIQLKETDIIRLQKETMVWNRKSGIIEKKVKELGIGVDENLESKGSIKITKRIKRIFRLDKGEEKIYREYGTYSFGDMIVIFKTNKDLLF